MNVVYPLAVDAFMRGEVDVTTDVLLCELLDGYVYDAADEWLDDIDGATRFGSPQSVTFDALTAGVLFVDPITFPSQPAGDTITAVVFYVDGASDAARRLLCVQLNGADTSPLSIDTNDGDVVLSYPRGVLKL